MTGIEDRLRQLSAGYGGTPDVDQELAEVVARGRRKRLGRAASAVGASAAVLGMVVLVATASTPAAVPRIDPAGPGAASPSSGPFVAHPTRLN